MFEEIKKWNLEQIEARATAIAAEIESADSAQLDALNDELNAIEERKAELAVETRKADMKAVAAGAGKMIAAAPEKEERSMNDVLESREYIDAFAEYIKTGDDKECRSLLTTNASGQLPVPTIVDNIVRTAWERDGIMSRVKKTYLKGNLKTTFERSASGAAVHNEGANAPTEEELLLGIVTMIPQNIKKWITISDEAVSMGGEAFVRYIYEELTYQIFKKMAADGIADITGAGTSHTATAIGIPQLSAAPGVTTFQKAITNLTDEADMGALVAVLNPATDAAVIDAVAAGNFSIDPYAGLKKVYTSALPAYAAASDGDVYAIVGDLSALQYNFPEGDDVIVKWDDVSLAEKDLVKVVGREYAAHAVTAPGRLVNIVKPGT